MVFLELSLPLFFLLSLLFLVFLLLASLMLMILSACAFPCVVLLTISLLRLHALASSIHGVHPHRENGAQGLL